MASRTNKTVDSRFLENGLAEQDASVPANSQTLLLVPKIDIGILEVWIEGITPLLVCAWSVKAKEMMLAKQMKKARNAKEAKNPQQNYLDSLYVSTEGWTGVPAGGIKGCIVNACRAVDSLPMTYAKRFIFVQSQGKTKEGQELVRVHGEHRMHEGMVRVAKGVADIRHRALYEKWSIFLQIQFLKNILSAEQVGNLIELAGFCEGLCEHRPGAPKSPTGNFGCFRIRREQQE